MAPWLKRLTAVGYRAEHRAFEWFADGGLVRRAEINAPIEFGAVPLFRSVSFSEVLPASYRRQS